ncbi:unnamed protein product [Bursaphelenchus xylophilus]|uniref:(pine wood nematode) hypothetical protein n=1 Tax=Bursaphelenchus xylophilus TaxID=6326 RepID=A0A1I7SCK8_BURXY|nr:unnamed protein product [Bursaphelenchus xylophilus]CAG9093926.1 unnamed protein product [Bursaphelenchus xylophilus]
MSYVQTLLFGSIFSAILFGYLANLYGFNLPPPKPKAVGIDLGTTFSSIGIHQSVNGKTQIIADALGKKSVPSVVSFLPNGTVLVGTLAVEHLEIYPKNTIYDAKRFIGKTFEADDPQFLADKERYPFEIELDSEKRAYFRVKLEEGERLLYPEEIGSIIVNYLKENAEKSMGFGFKNLVISVPAEFAASQRNKTREAAEKAGFNVWRVISEPTAAALAYGLDKKNGVTFVIVVDLGGGTMDVSVLMLQGGMFVTQSLAGNNRLGGQDFNNLIQQFIVKKIESGSDKKLTNKEDLQQLRLAIEQAKVRLTDRHETWIKIDLKQTGKFEYLLTREEFETICEPLFDAVVDPIEAALEDAELTPSDIDEIVLVGGSTQIPRVRQIVGKMFGKTPNFGIDPELAVVTGVAVQADVLAGGWPLKVAALELESGHRKRHIYYKDAAHKRVHSTEKLDV